MPTRDRYLRHLAKVPSFSSCSERELAAVARHCTDVVFAPGQVLVREGVPGYELFVIVEGTAAVTRGGEEIAILTAGHFFGELALLRRAPRNASVTAITRLEAVVIQSQELGALLEEAPTLRQRLLSALQQRVQAPEAVHATV